MVLEAMRNGQITKVKVEDDPLLNIKKPAQEVLIQQNEIEK